MTVAVAVSERIHEVDADEWDRLAVRVGAPVFYRTAFLRASEERPLQPTEACYYLTARRDGRLVLALPAYLQPVDDPFGALDTAVGRPVSRVLLSHLWHCYDSRIVREDADGEVARAAWAALSDLAADAGADAFGLFNVSEPDALVAQLGHGVRVSQGTPRYQLRWQEAGSVDSHVAGLGRATRKTLRQYVRRAERSQVGVSVESAAKTPLDDVLELCEETAAKHAPGYYRADPLGHLLRSLGDDALILRLRQADRTLAASVCLLDEQRLHAWAGGCRYPEELNFSPQYVLFHAELCVARDSGRPVLEAGRRNDEFKRRHGLRPVALHSVVGGGG